MERQSRRPGFGSTATAMPSEQTPERTTDAAFAMYLLPDRSEASAATAEASPEQAAANYDVDWRLLQLASRIYRPEDTVDTPLARPSARTQHLDLAIADDWDAWGLTGMQIRRLSVWGI
jgi:hypothetical protein